MKRQLAGVSSFIFIEAADAVTRFSWFETVTRPAILLGLLSAT